MKGTRRQFYRNLPIAVLLLMLVLFFYFRLDRFVNFDALKKYRMQLLQWTDDHYFLSVLTYMVTYILFVAISIPGAVFLTLLGGFLFGIMLGALYTIIAATIGAAILFLAVKYALAQWLMQVSNKWIAKMRNGFRKDAFNYLLFLRLIPLFPFWAVNAVAGLMNVKLSVFVITTFLGIIPGTFIYAGIGSGLGQVLETDETPRLNIIFEPYILLPLVGIAILALLPIIYRFMRGTKK